MVAATARGGSAPSRAGSRADGLAGRGRPRFLEIAGFRFALPGGRAALPFPAPYRSFLHARHRGRGCVVLRVGVRVDPGLQAPANPAYRTDAWSVSRERGTLVVALCPEALGGAALVTARLDAAASRVDLRVSDRGIPAFSYPVDQVLMMHLLARRQGAIIHAAGFGLGGRGFAFPGCSGAGKTTLARLLRAVPGWRPLSDDRVIVRRTAGRHRVFGTPWPGEGEVAENRSFPLSGVVFLKHGTRTRLAPLEPAACVNRLIPVTSIPWHDREAFPQLLEFCGALASSVPAWELTFKPGRTVGVVLARLLAAGRRPR